MYEKDTNSDSRNTQNTKYTSQKTNSSFHITGKAQNIKNYNKNKERISKVAY